MKTFIRSLALASTLLLVACSNTTTMDNGLVIEDIKKGSGPAAEPGNILEVHYVGTLEDGTQFDSSRDRNAPFTFELGAGRVIEGWELGMEGMQVGGLRKLTIPAELGYGNRATGSIPAGSTLIFEVEMLGIE